MGVSGVGKTTIANALSVKLGWPVRDGDEFHPPANIAKMRAGTPLEDADRWPWLEAIAAWIDDRRRVGAPGIVTCSALKRRYRDVLIGRRPGVRLVFLTGGEALIRDRLRAREGHFMPPALLASQFAALEEPTPEEGAITVCVEDTPEAICARVLSELSLAVR
ncbi:MAG: gluconokinase [Hyphomicrobiaceae bacterium]|nr:MAG: gluconokinase [Hyphomicrobiaceae bacterium]